jgi:hypothetical protein
MLQLVERNRGVGCVGCHRGGQIAAAGQDSGGMGNVMGREFNSWAALITLSMRLTICVCQSGIILQFQALKGSKWLIIIPFFITVEIALLIKRKKFNRLTETKIPTGNPSIPD